MLMEMKKQFILKGALPFMSSEEPGVQCCSPVSTVPRQISTSVPVHLSRRAGGVLATAAPVHDAAVNHTLVLPGHLRLPSLRFRVGEESAGLLF